MKKHFLCMLGIHKDRLFDSKSCTLRVCNRITGRTGEIDGHANIFRCERPGCGKLSAQLIGAGSAQKVSVEELVEGGYYPDKGFPSYEELVVLRAITDGGTI